MTEIQCLDCGIPLEYSGRGRPPLRCKNCRAARTRKRKTEYQRERYNADPEYRLKMLDNSNQWYAKNKGKGQPTPITQLIKRLHMRPHKGDPLGTVYIAGPMTGLPDYNRPAFHAAAKRWLKDGYEVYNPAMAAEESTLEEIFAADIAALARCNIVSFLPGWEESKGAAIEMKVARYLGKTRIVNGDILMPGKDEGSTT